MATKRKVRVKGKVYGILKSKKFRYAVGIAVIVGILKGFDAPDIMIDTVKYAGTLLMAGHTITDIVSMIMNK